MREALFLMHFSQQARRDGFLIFDADGSRFFACIFRPTVAEGFSSRGGAAAVSFDEGHRDVLVSYTYA